MIMYDEGIILLTGSSNLTATTENYIQPVAGYLSTTSSTDNLKWIQDARHNQLVVGSKARILYADAEGRIKIAKAINTAIRQHLISAPVVLGRDHHDGAGPLRQALDDAAQVGRGLVPGVRRVPVHEEAGAAAVRDVHGGQAAREGGRGMFGVHGSIPAADEG